MTLQQGQLVRTTPISNRPGLVGCYKYGGLRLSICPTRRNRVLLHVTAIFEIIRGAELRDLR